MDFLARRDFWQKTKALSRSLSLSLSLSLSRDYPFFIELQMSVGFSMEYFYVGEAALSTKGRVFLAAARRVNSNTLRNGSYSEWRRGLFFTSDNGGQKPRPSFSPHIPEHPFRAFHYKTAAVGCYKSI
jgi:hypothetical protein